MARRSRPVRGPQGGRCARVSVCSVRDHTIERAGVSAYITRLSCRQLGTRPEARGVERVACPRAALRGGVKLRCIFLHSRTVTTSVYALRVGYKGLVSALYVSKMYVPYRPSRTAPRARLCLDDVRPMRDGPRRPSDSSGRCHQRPEAVTERQVRRALRRAGLWRVPGVRAGQCASGVRSGRSPVAILLWLEAPRQWCLGH